MLQFIWNLLAFIFALGVLITVHEFGHFISALYCGVTVRRFSIGFGKKLFKWIGKNGTEYIIAVIPFGGYVKMLDSRVDVVALEDYPKTFNNKTIWQRGIIIFSGPFFNILFAVLSYWLVFVIGLSAYRPILGNVISNSEVAKVGIISGMEIQSIDDVSTPDWDAVRFQIINKIGKKEIKISVLPCNDSSLKEYNVKLRNLSFKQHQDPITTLGMVPIMPNVEPVVMDIQKGSSAMVAGFQVGDRIISVDNNMLVDWQFLVETIRNSPKKILNCIIDRNGSLLNIKLMPDERIISTDRIEGFAGITPKILPLSEEYKITYRFGLLKALSTSLDKVYQLICFTVSMLEKLIFGDIKISSLGGPISIAQGAGMSAGYGFVYYLMFLAMISINLGVINLLPIPILDGGYLLFLMIEQLRGKPLSDKLQTLSYRMGFILLSFVMCLAIFNDLSRL